MDYILGFLEKAEALVPLVRTIIAVIVVLVLFKLILRYTKGKLLKRAKTRKEISNIKMFSRIANYSFILVLLMFVIFTYAGSWAGIGLSLGLFSAALGWALQKPITGMAGWIMVVMKRPFYIGDRIIIGKVRGDVLDITLTHIKLGEVGGIVAGEENSGRTILVPNSKLFEEDIVNYTMQDDYILDQVMFNITFESSTEKAEGILVESATKFTKEAIKETGKKPYTRVSSDSNGMIVKIRYMTPAKNMQEISTKITREVHDRIMKTRGVTFAYQHNDVLMNRR
jgi:small-conductance mechanosensitive channel